MEIKKMLENMIIEVYTGSDNPKPSKKEIEDYVDEFLTIPLLKHSIGNQKEALITEIFKRLEWDYSEQESKDTAICILKNAIEFISGREYYNPMRKGGFINGDALSIMHRAIDKVLS